MGKKATGDKAPGDEVTAELGPSEAGTAGKGTAERATPEKTTEKESGRQKRRAAQEYELPVALKLVYKPVGILSGIVGGVIAGQVFARVWKRISDETPQPLSSASNTREVLLAATLQGAIFGLVKTTVDRLSMQLYRKAVETPLPPSSSLARERQAAPVLEIRPAEPPAQPAPQAEQA